MTGYCTQCDREVRVTEQFAFGGMDRVRASLACGHVVPRVELSEAATTA